MKTLRARPTRVPSPLQQGRLIRKGSGFPSGLERSDKNEDPVIKGVKPGLEYGEWLSRIRLTGLLGLSQRFQLEDLFGLG
jgi:hypothetical protein